MSRVMTHKYVAWETGWLQVTFTELILEVGAETKKPTLNYPFEVTVRDQSGEDHPMPH